MRLRQSIHPEAATGLSPVRASRGQPDKGNIKPATIAKKTKHRSMLDQGLGQTGMDIRRARAWARQACGSCDDYCKEAEAGNGGASIFADPTLQPGKGFCGEKGWNDAPATCAYRILDGVFLV